MKKVISLSFLLLNVITLLCACDGKNNSSRAVAIDEDEEAKAQRQMEVCANRYGDRLDDAQWKESFSELSLMKDELFTKASSVAYDYSNYMEGREISYDEESGRFRVLVMDVDKEKKDSLEAYIDGCSFWFKGFDSFKSDTFEISPCLCKEEDGKTLYLNKKSDSDSEESSSSESLNSDSSSARGSSSSSVRGSSSSSVRGSSSSSARSSSSSFDRSSSSSVSRRSSSSMEEIVSEYSSERESSSSKVVVVCPERPADVLPDSREYTVAYEFNDPNNIGKDFFGLNDAHAGEGNPRGDCDNIVLDGHSGLIIPLSETFTSNAFFIETRIYPEAFDDMQNIIVSEPPGSGYSGWQLRLDNGKLRFHLRDFGKDNSHWTIFDAGTVPLNEWTTILVVRSLSGTVEIWVNDEIAFTGEYSGNAVNVTYDLGIGYDAVVQGGHDDRFFIGKIDYLRFGKVSE